MVHITEEQVEEYRRLVYARYGEEIDRQLARAELTVLICLMDVILRHVDEED